MDKVFEALKRIETTFSMNKEGKESVYREYTNSIYPYYEDFDLVLNALNELKAIKEAKPSEAVECSLNLYKMVESAGNGNGFNLNEAWKYHNSIKEALLKTEKLENVWEIVKKKGVNVGEFKKDLDWDKFDYSFYLCYYKQFSLKELTREEFDLLKEVLEDETK